MADNLEKNAAKPVVKPTAVVAKKDVVGESKGDKFKRLASKRVVSAIQKIELITNLSASSYESTPEEVTKILAALQASVDKVKAAFSKQKIEKSVFKL